MTMKTVKNEKLVNKQRKFTNSYPVVDYPVFDKNQIISTNEQLLNNIFAEAPSESAAKIAVKKGTFYSIPLPPMQNLLSQFLASIEFYNAEFFGYDLYPIYSPNMYNYNIYEEGDEYGWHIDAYHTPKSSIKLTCLINLSEEPYEGGELEIAGYDNSAFNFNIPGTALIFNSIMAHRVTPVTKGKRITLSLWAAGPSWK